MSTYDYHLTDILRGVSVNNNMNVNKYADESSIDTAIWDAANEKASTKENKTAITVLLEDFAQLTNSFNNNRSCINEENTEKGGFFARLFGRKTKDNVFKTDVANETIKNNGVYYQRDIFEQEVAKNGGIKYAAEGADIYESALNFAKADTAAIEKSFNNAYPDHGGKSKQLDIGEIGTVANEKIGFIKDAVEELNLDKKKKRVSPEEYASYMIAVDSLISTGSKKSDVSYSMDSVDGLVSKEEVALAMELDNDELKNLAQTIYDEHYKK